ncbi:hypothetical protein DPX16_14596 [Anabarilius grahami]|uniref:PiggyBac transposable element-derived protein domain-containing protein n=1 Tax=Anabarilius grahami TaxID=495550 RepID=A0A3N0YXN5_ANAGA|nr:hypothetical protein DPX16_14596 [Anabarilius grahami]
MPRANAKKTVDIAEDVDDSTRGAEGAAGASDQGDDIRELFGGIRSEVAAHGAENLAELKSFISAVKTLLLEHEQKLKDVGESLTDVDGRFTNLESTCLTKDNEKLRAKIDNLENCSKRNNIRVIGIREGSEAGGELFPCRSHGFAVPTPRCIELHKVFSTTAATLTAYAPKRKKTVYILSSMHSVIQTDNTTKRKPNTVTLYNTTKCGVDVMDQMVREYTVRTGTRRWPVAVFYNMIDMAALNAHVLYQACTGRQERRVDFLVELARELANSHMCAKKARKEQLLRTPPSTPSPGKRAMCQVKHQCKNNHSTVRCVHCYRYTCGKCRREIPWQCQDCE